MCTQCGVVDEEHLMDDRPEWRDYADAADDGGGAGGASLARCGMVAVDESLYIGGLQPTTLSRHLYGGPTGAGSNSSSGGAPRQLQLRQRLAATARRIDRRMAQLSARSLEAARWHRRASQAHRKRTFEMASSLESGTDGDTTHDEEDGDNECSSADLRPEYEQLLLQEEEDAARVRDAIYADKWSLSRAIQLFGTDHEISLLKCPDPTLDEEERGTGGGTKRRRLDSTLTQASRDLYRAYTMLRQCANRLQLPERVQGEAVAWLCRYAGRCDGLTVRGVSSAGPSPKRLGELGTATRCAASPRQERLVRASLGEQHKLKQSGALCAALVFYSCRCQGWPRPLDEVCASVQPLSDPSTAGSDNSLHVAVEPGTTVPFIQKKHCSRAMSDVRRVFPELAQKLAALVAPTHDQSRAADKLRVDVPDPVSILANLVEHKVRNLQLPPVAEAVVRSLACHWQQLQLHSQSSSDVSVKDGGKWSALCAALTLFACHAGSIMQRLALQATKSKRRKLAKHEALPLQSFSFDAFDCSSTEADSAEQRAYEMGRVWDAWSEQTPWYRSLAEVERSFQVPAGSILDVYRKQVYPQRSRLLHHLQNSVATTRPTDDGMALPPAAFSRDSLRGTPLSSVLLPQIPVVSALLNEDPTQQAQ